MSDIAKAYASGDIKGWGGHDNDAMVKAQFKLLSDEFDIFRIAGQTVGTTDRKTFLTDAVKIVTGGNFLDTQLTGDCVSWGGKHATEIVTCTQIIGLAVTQKEMAIADYIGAARLKFRRIFAPYYYGTSRIYEGKGQLGRADGSLGSWMFAAAKRWGALFEDENGVPKYSKQIADSWGYDHSGIDKWKDVAVEYPIQSGAAINNWDDLCASIHNGYGVPTASNYGYSMEPYNDGFHHQVANWAHQMCFVGVDETWKEPYALLMNQWGDVHGHLKDFQTGDPLPPGVLRIRRADAEKHLKYGENYAYSKFKGFPEQQLDKSLFMLI